MMCLSSPPLVCFPCSEDTLLDIWCMVSHVLSVDQICSRQIECCHPRPQQVAVLQISEPTSCHNHIQDCWVRCALCQRHACLPQLAENLSLCATDVRLMLEDEGHSFSLLVRNGLVRSKGLLPWLAMFTCWPLLSSELQCQQRQVSTTISKW